jgi:hypothetical protein
MLRNSLLLLGLILLNATCSLAQGLSQTIRGRITDADSQQALEGATVVILGLNPQPNTLSDAKGTFRFSQIPPGRYGIKVILLGYNEYSSDNLILSSGKELVLEIQLSEKVFESKAVEIVAEREKWKPNNEMATLSARAFDPEESNRYAGSRGDPSRMATNFAGVASGNDARNDIVVRGNSPLGVLWRLEGMDIPSPNHFSAQGATGGPISILNNNLLGASDFFTGAFPAEYGNRLAAAFDLRMRNGNNEKREYTGQVGINGFELGAEGPIDKNSGSSYLVSYRYSTLKAFDLLGIRFGVSGVPQYQDGSFKVHLPTKKNGVISIWGIGGISSISLLDSEKGNDDWAFTNRGSDLVYGSRMGAAGINHQRFFNEKTSGKLSIAISGARFDALVDTISVSNEKFRTFTNKSIDTQTQIQYVFQSKINSRNLVKAGTSMYLLGVDYSNEQFNRRLQRNIYLLNVQENSGFSRAFIHWQNKPGARWVINSGLHLQHFWLNNKYRIEPRLGLKYQVNNRHSLGAAVGEHSQMQPLIYYFLESYRVDENQYIQTNRNLDFSKSRHFILSWDWLAGQKLRIKSEAYYQQLYDIPVEQHRSSWSILNSGRDIGLLDLADSLVNKGSGENYGWELTIEKFFSNNFYYLFTTSLYQSKYTGSDGVKRYTAFSGNHVFNALAGYEWPFGKNNNALSLDLRYTKAGGNRFTPVNLELSQQLERQVLDYDRAFTAKYPDYERFDVKISLRLNHRNTSQSIYISLENILNRKNILRQYYDPRLARIVTEYQFGLFPIGGYRIEF